MLERPDLPDATLLACFRESYGVPAARIEFMPIGNDSSAFVYRVEADDGRSYFLKAKRGDIYVASLFVPRYLAESGIEQVVAPVMPNGAHPRIADLNLILYPYIEGENGMDVGLNVGQWTELGAVLRRIHAARLPPDLAAQVRREDFVPPWAETVRELAERIEAGAAHDLYERELAAIWQPRRDEIARLVARTEELGAMLQAQAHDLVLCHADIHTANLLIDAAGGLHIVDWDGVVFAPKERDPMFIDEEQRPFFEGYGEVAIDPLTLAYYRYEWAVQEIGDYGARVFSLETGAETKADSVRGLLQLFEPGDVVDIAYLFDV